MPTETFTTDTSWTVPSGVTEVEITAYGAAGADGDDNNGFSGGNGASGRSVTGTLSVSEGDTLYFRKLYGGGPGDNTSADNPRYGGAGGNGFGVRYNGFGTSNVVLASAGDGGSVIVRVTNGSGSYQNASIGGQFQIV